MRLLIPLSALVLLSLTGCGDPPPVVGDNPAAANARTAPDDAQTARADSRFEPKGL